MERTNEPEDTTIEITWCEQPKKIEWKKKSSISGTVELGQKLKSFCHQSQKQEEKEGRAKNVLK